ncbi:hypothetical protein L211DRAFT_782832 [Terfezia boudieri ATCC MYA-4762]|uniref:C2H2-type domain-containing protein n=1 Tax=Terfezia boudieri ATCC MYA-4762 TaxID=1051890 RepID=A0A3N4M5Q7_9PEZI|nr:hypothetical protein L211DRAFT_782832 [Terfezia boudieri ATCC MYA-4762]
MGAIRRSKTKRRERDVDQVHSDLRNPRQLEQHKALIPDEDRPGLGKFYCVECAKYFESAFSQEHHLTGKRHKRRVRFLKEAPYSQAEADAAVGVGVQSFTAKVLKAKKEEELGQKEMEIDIEL